MVKVEKLCKNSWLVQNVSLYIFLEYPHIQEDMWFFWQTH